MPGKVRESRKKGGSGSKEPEASPAAGGRKGERKKRNQGGVANFLEVRTNRRKAHMVRKEKKKYYLPIISVTWKKGGKKLELSGTPLNSSQGDSSNLRTRSERGEGDEVRVMVGGG